MRKILSLLACFSITNIYANFDYTDDYNVTWNTPSRSVYETMPVGGGDIGLNVWVEDGNLLFYIGQSGTFDENNTMMKQGRVRVKMTPNPFDESTEFSQTLRLKTGDMEIKSINVDNDVKILLWVDIFKPIIHLEIKSSKDIDMVAQYESWRTKDRTISGVELFSSYSYYDYVDGEITRFADAIECSDDAINWVHRSKDDFLVRDFCIEQQGLTSVEDKIYNPQKGRTFGGSMWCDGLVYSGTEDGEYMLTPYKAYKLSSTKPKKRFDLSIALCVGQYETQELWQKQLNENIERSKTDKGAKKKCEESWREFWDRSYIMIGEKGTPQWEVGLKYQLFRYMLACNAYGEFPSKFNGSFFTVDAEVGAKPFKGLDADFRKWGGGSFTAQNQRLVYWPMLKSGDFDMMQPQFNYYKNSLSSAIARTEHYWGHEGASFTEQLENFGLPIGAAWGYKSGSRRRDPSTEVGELSNQWISNHYTNQLEFSFMILQYYKFCNLPIDEYLPFIKNSILFFDKHYRYEFKRLSGQELDENGKLVFYPSTAAEMYKVAKNPADVIAAMNATIAAVLDLPEKYVSVEEREYYEDLLSRVPNIPIDVKSDKQVIKPAESWAYVSNQEIPELYPLFPYGIYGVGKPDLDIALNTWEYGESAHKKSFLLSWSQVGIFAARLGLRDEASELLLKRVSNSKQRFPAFWGPGVDWLPDFNHGGSCMIALQEMLMQTIDDDGKIYIFPSWKKEWDVKFKMHAPHNTIVEAELKDGQLVILNVTPKSREQDIKVML